MAPLRQRLFRDSRTDSRQASRGQPWGWITPLGFLLLLLLVLHVYLLVEIWPAVTAEPAEAGGVTKVEFFGDDPSFQLSHEGAFVVLALLAGAIGSLLHAVISFTDFVGNRRFRASWIWWYLARAPVGAVLALIFFVALRAGLLTTDANLDDVNPFGIAALSFLAGLFAKQAMDKLDQVFTAFWGSKDAARADSLANPVPVITSIEPAEFRRQDTVRLVITGKGFVEESKVRVSSVAGTDDRILPGEPEYVGPETLQVAVGKDAFTESGVVHVTVVNPEPGGGVSGPHPVTIIDGDDSSTELRGEPRPERRVD